MVVVVVVEEDEGEDKLEKGKDVSRQAGDDKSFLSVPRPLCCVCVEWKNNQRPAHTRAAREVCFARTCPKRTGNTCVRAAQRPETGSSAQDLSTLPTGV